MQNDPSVLHRDGRGDNDVPDTDTITNTVLDTDADAVPIAIDARTHPRPWNATSLPKPIPDPIATRLDAAIPRPGVIEDEPQPCWSRCC